MEELLDSPAELLNPLPARYRNGDTVMLENVGPLAAFLWLHGHDLKDRYPDLWNKTQASMAAAHDDRQDRTKAKDAWQVAWNLLNAAKLLA